MSQTPNRSLPAGAPVLIQVPVVNADALSGFAAPIAPVNLVSITA